jgi:hypothetical protein
MIICVSGANGGKSMVPRIHQASDGTQIDFFEVTVERAAHGSRRGSACRGRCTRDASSCVVPACDKLAFFDGLELPVRRSMSNWLVSGILE